MSETQAPWVKSNWLSKTDAARYIHKDVRELQQLIDTGEIPASAAARAHRGRLGSQVVYLHIEDLDAYMRSIPYTGLICQATRRTSTPSKAKSEPNDKAQPRTVPMTYERGQKIAETVRLAAERSRKRKKKSDTSQSQ